MKTIKKQSRTQITNMTSFLENKKLIIELTYWILAYVHKTKLYRTNIKIYINWFVYINKKCTSQ